MNTRSPPQTRKKILRTNGALTLEGFEQHPISVETADIAHGAMSIESPRQLNTGQRCRITFAFLLNGQKRDVSLSAKIMHCVYGSNRFKVGVQIVEMDEAGAAAIAKFLSV